MKWLRTKMRYVPNTLSVYRISASPVLLLLVILNEADLFKWLLLASLVSDILDGLIARTFHFQSELGARLDSIGDMSTFIAASIGVIFFQKTFIIEHGLGISLVLGFYLLQIIVAFLKFRRIMSYHTTLARITAYMQGIFVMALFMFGFQQWLFYPTVCVSIITYSEEMILVLFMHEHRSNVGGLLRVFRERRSAGSSVPS